MIKQWWNAPAAPWQFWLPQSGLIGGVLAAALIYHTIGLILIWI